MNSCVDLNFSFLQMTGESNECPVCSYLTTLQQA